MNKFLTLIKVLLKSSGESLVQKDKRKLPKTIALIILMVVAFIPMIAGFVTVAAVSYEGLARVNQEGLILELGVLASSLVIFIFGFSYVLSTFYFSTDIENLLPLPLKPSMIIGSKFTVVLIYEYLTEILFLLPIVITYGIMSASGFVYYLYSIIIFLLLPIVPLVVSSLISMFIMRFAPFTKNKDAFRTIAGVLGLIIALGFSFAFQKLGGNTQSAEDIVKLMMQGKNSLVGTSSAMFPAAKLAVNSMIYSGETRGLLNMFLFLIITAAFMGVLFIIGDNIYFKGVVGISESSSKRRKLRKKELEESTTQNSTLKAYTIKELKILFRTPAYFMNCVLMNFLFPIVLFIPALAQPDMMKDLHMAKELLNKGTLPGTIIAVCFGVIMFISVANPTACTAISREGSNIFVCKYLPISYKKQIMSKVLSAVLLNFIGVGLLVLTLSIVLNPPVYLIIQVIILSVIITFFASFVGIFIDLMFPKLLWDNEQRAVKNNLNVIILMLVGFAVGTVTILGTVLLRLNVWTAFGILTIIYGILDLGLYFLLSSVGVKVFSKI